MKSTNIFSRFLPGHAARVHRDSITHISTRTDYTDYISTGTSYDSKPRSMTAYRPPQPWDNTIPMNDAAALKRRGEVPQMDRRAYRGRITPHAMPVPPAAPSTAVSREERIALADLEAMLIQASFNRPQPVVDTSPEYRPTVSENPAPAFESRGGGDFAGGGSGGSWATDSPAPAPSYSSNSSSSSSGSGSSDSSPSSSD